MTSKAAGFLLLSAVLLFSGAALSAEVKIGYLGLQGDPRYHPDVVYTRIEIAPGGNPIDGATMGVDELKVVSDAVDQQVVLDHQEATDAASLVAKVGEMARGESNSSSSTCRRSSSTRWPRRPRTSR